MKQRSLLLDLFLTVIDIALFTAVWYFGHWWLAVIVFIWSMLYYQRIVSSVIRSVEQKYAALVSAMMEHLAHKIEVSAAKPCNKVPPGNGYCDMCAAGHYERCRYVVPAREQDPDFVLPRMGVRSIKSGQLPDIK